MFLETNSWVESRPAVSKSLVLLFMRSNELIQVLGGAQGRPKARHAIKNTAYLMKIKDLLKYIMFYNVFGTCTYKKDS